MERKKKSLFVVLQEKKAERGAGSIMARVGVGFFFQPRRAVTCDDVLVESVKLGDTVTVECQEAGMQMRLRVLKRDAELDFAVLTSERRDAPAFLEPYSGDLEDLSGQKITLCELQPALDEVLPGESYQVGYLPVIWSRLTRSHRQLLYDSNSRSSHPGGALVSFDGKVVGMHQETLNRVREFCRQEEITAAKFRGLASSLGLVLNRNSLLPGSIALLAHVFAS